MEEKHEEAEDVESCSSDSFIVDSDDDEPSTSGQDDGTIIEEPLTEKEIEELVAEFLEVESKAAEAQEALEKESLNKVESEVREELAQTLHGDELEAAIKDEMNAFKEEWENTLDELETESAHLLEQLDGAGIELPSLYKWIESQVPDGCCTEAWKRRALWVGSQMTSEINEAVANAEKYLHVHRPVRRRHGKLLEEGASGFLEKKFAAEGSNEALAENGEVDWPSLKKFFSGNVSEDVATFGSKHWASVYLANTPQEAAMLGVKFPGLNEIEEIEDIDADSNDPFVVDAIENERELVLSEEQRRNYRKVKEEDDVKSDRKLQLRLRKRINHKRSKQAVTQKELGCVEGVNRNNLDVLSCSNGHPHNALEEKGRNGEDMPEISEISGNHREKKSTSNGNLGSSESPLPDVIEPTGSKRPNEGEDSNEDGKRQRTIMSNNDSESDIEKDQPAFDGIKVDDQSTLQGNTGDHGAEESLNEKFNCTACNSVAEEVHPHPLLKVIICKDCKLLIDEKKHVEDSDCSLSYCEWCGRTGDFISCRSCKRLFCIACIQRNIDEECLSKVQGSRWQCCCCSPSQIQRLTSQLEEAIETDDCMVTSSDSDSETSDPDIGVSISSKRKRKKKIRRILDDAELGEETKRKIAIEKERQDRLKSLKVQFSGRSKLINPLSFSGKLPEGASVEVLGDAMTGYIVNVVREEGEEAVRIPPSISAKLKAHQVAGIRFLWENIIQSIGKVKSGDKGLGCILAHTMGLGKTFQVIAFLYTAMRSVDLGLRTALIVTPVSVLHNWRREFMKWNPPEVKPLRVLMLEDVQREKRAELLAKWRAKGGIFLISYTSFRNLSVGKNVKDRNVAKEISSALQDGPDILVCDEAHMIKNTRADTTQALKQVKCQRRIALTGSPLQNNLMEYYCMVDFVREGFLGSSHEFRNRFQNPIENGQHTNSTADDVKTMNQRSHILYEQLKGFVQRMDMSVVKKDLPPKTVFVIAVKLSPLQRKLYKRFLDVHGFTNGRVSNEKMRKSFFAGYQALAQILNHPGILQLRKDKYDSCREDAAENLLADECSSDENVDFNTVIGEKTRNANFVPAKHDDGFLQKDWWNDLLEENNYKERDFSGKMVLLLDILTMSSEVGDKTLVFSQSIPTLDLIELHLSRLSRHGKKGKFWRRGKDWYRLDGRTESSERQKLVERFNDPANKRVKCSLISTRAGSLGINLYAANRVVIVDGSWNPTYDLQAIYRAWRYGQTKPVFAYRLMAHGTMEEKIYKRQVTKEGLAARVVDRQQINRTISREEMLHLFDFGDEENTDALADLSQEERLADSLYMTNRTGNPVKQKVDLSMASCSSDKLMETLLGKHDPRWIANYHEHETLLQENEDEKLTKEEQDMAWEVYRKSLEWEEEVLRTPVGESAFEQKPPMPNVVPPAPIIGSQRESSIAPPAPDPPGIVVAQSMLRRGKMQRRCTNLAHMLTLRSQGTKVGCVTVCGECAREISWEDLSGNAGMPR